jgi:hypothetical protein
MMVKGSVAMKRGRMCLRLGIVMLACAMLGGCSRRAEIAGLVPIAGIVMLDGAPLSDTDVAIRFHPDTAQGNASPYIPTCSPDALGRFEMKTNIYMGVHPGWYRVTVTDKFSSLPFGEQPVVKPLQWAKKYTDASTTDLLIEVRPNAPSGSYDLHLTK